MKPRNDARIVWLVMRREFLTTVSRRSFWLTTFLLPLFLLVLTVGMQTLTERSLGETGTLTPGPGASTAAIGYVDQSGILRNLPPDLPAGALRPFADEASAQGALRRGDVTQYYLIPADYVQTGALAIVTRDYRPLAANQVSPLVTYALNYGLTGDQRVAALLFDPAPQLETHVPGGRRGRSFGGRSSGLRRALRGALHPLPGLVMSGGFMLTSVSKEKENRTAEVLLVSLRPRDLMLGKIAGPGRRGPAADGHLAGRGPAGAEPGAAADRERRRFRAARPVSSRGRWPTFSWGSSSTPRFSPCLG